MAGSIMSGGEFESESSGKADSSDVFAEPVILKTENFSGTAVPLFLLPGLPVMDAMTSPEPQKAMKMFHLFMLALNTEQAVEDVQIVSFIELNQLIGQWVGKSLEMQTGVPLDFPPELE